MTQTITTEPTTTTMITKPAITISGEAAAGLVEVLGHCEQFLTVPTTRAELIDFCASRPALTSGWLIDMLGWHALHLRARIADASRSASQTGRRR